MPYSMTEEVKKEVQQMQKMGVIEHSDSPYSFPIVMVKKKDGTTDATSTLDNSTGLH